MADEVVEIEAQAFEISSKDVKTAIGLFEADGDFIGHGSADIVPALGRDSVQSRLQASDRVCGGFRGHFANHIAV